MLWQKFKNSLQSHQYCDRNYPHDFITYFIISGRQLFMSNGNFSLVDLKGISEPITKLIETVSNAIGILYEPTRIRREARAEADAAVILAKNKAEIKDIEMRASERFYNQEIRRQRNIENITKKAVDALPERVSKEPLDEDWVYQFFQHCQDIGNDEMQSLWGRLLAGEVTNPGSFSLRTLRLVKEISKEDAHLFTKLCTFVWKDEEQKLFPVILDIYNEHISETGLNFSSLLHLDSLGLIKLETITGFALSTDTSELNLFYNDKSHFLKLPGGKKDLEIGVALLTAIGAELAPISGTKPSEEYRRWIVDCWRKKDIVVEDQEG